MANNAMVLMMSYGLRDLLDRVTATQQTEDRLWDISLAQWTHLSSQVDDLLARAKSAPASAGIWVSTNLSVIPFMFEDKISLEGAQQMVACHWRNGLRSEPPKALVERWNMHHSGKTWRCLCDEEGMLNGSHPNPLVSRMRNAMNAESKRKFGHGPIHGDVLIINNKCGW
jgi:hypothetical protein